MAVSEDLGRRSVVGRAGLEQAGLEQGKCHASDLGRRGHLELDAARKIALAEEAVNAIAASAVRCWSAAWHHPGPRRRRPPLCFAKLDWLGLDRRRPVTRFPSGPGAPRRQGLYGACGRMSKAGLRDLASPGRWHLEPPIRPARPVTGARVLPVCAGRKREPRGLLALALAATAWWRRRRPRANKVPSIR